LPATIREGQGNAKSTTLARVTFYVQTSADLTDIFPAFECADSHPVGLGAREGLKKSMSNELLAHALTSLNCILYNVPNDALQSLGMGSYTMASQRRINC